MSFKFSMKYFFLFLLIIIVISCDKKNQLEKEIAKININITAERFDRFVAEASLDDFHKLKQAYPFMFSEKDTDSTWREMKSDTLQIQLFKEVNEEFQNFEPTEEAIESLFNHLNYYFPEFKPPRVITTTSYVDFRNSIFLSDAFAVIALDTYLGPEHPFYTNIQKFIRENFKQQQIVVDLAGEYAKKYIYQKQNKTLLDEMIYFGKQLYFKETVVPFKTDKEQIGYSEEQLNWAMVNESYIWRYFIERELLFSTDSKLLSRFINPAPFSKFYLEEIDTDSPGRLGQYIGWQIVRAYMKQNDVSLNEMLITSAEDIFNNSKFKPRK